MDETPIEDYIILSALGISASYNAAYPVLNNLTIELKRGEFLAILGASGCGKTTLLKCLAGLYPVYQGKLTFRNQEYANNSGLLVNAQELRHSVTYVPQEITLLGHYTIRKNLSIVLNGHSKLDAERRICELVSRLRLTTEPSALLDRYPDELSGGQRQRVQLARALLNNPIVLLLDEVTSQIDPEASDAVMATIRSIREMLPELAMIIVTHNVEFATEFADRLQWLDEGKLVDYTTGEKR